LELTGADTNHVPRYGVTVPGVKTKIPAFVSKISSNDPNGTEGIKECDEGTVNFGLTSGRSGQQATQQSWSGCILILISPFAPQTVDHWLPK